jgi:hypothetical protein
MSVNVQDENKKALPVTIGVTGLPSVCRPSRKRWGERFTRLVGSVDRDVHDTGPFFIDLFWLGSESEWNRISRIFSAIGNLCG